MPLYYCKVKGAEVEGAVVSEPLNFLYLSCIYALKSYIIKLSLSVCMCVCVCMSVRNRLPNHAYYGDETFTGDSMDLE